jgi:hypothetical protein
MLRSFVLVGLLLASCWLGSSSWSQEKGTPKKKAPIDAIPGYKIHTIQGYTVVVSQDVLDVDTSKMKRTPLEAIEFELKNVSTLLTGKAVETMRKIPVWAEWDERIAVGNGRSGVAYGTYYSGNQFQALVSGMNPKKAKCVVIHLTKNLTEEYQEKTKPDQLLLLHEFAHAVHDQLLGFDHAGIQTGFQQAMARKLYEKSSYCATNDKEFFAEMTCAYLDRISYFPNKRADLQKHDPATFKLMETIWGKASADRGKVAAAVRPPDGSSEFKLDLSLSDIKLGEQISGPKFDPATTAGKIDLMKKNHPKARATEEAEKIAKEFLG